ncbi:MAG TPA: PIG-L family deacetylase [Verrucomicrobiae bacterium]|jgi:LmbE family N-acetylglucosaminyl deacetylase
MATNPYHQFVSSYAHLLAAGHSLPVGQLPLRGGAAPRREGPVALIFSPHPDDECIIGGLALRLMRESKARIVNVPVTLGSNPDRRQARLQELKKACDWLGFALDEPAPGGLDRINPQTRENNRAHWADAVKSITTVLARHQPRAVFFPHENDANSTHIGTHWLVMDALRTMPRDFECLAIETEFWAPMASPNLMVESNIDDVAELVAALSLHAGEVRRNPYHLRMPPWLQDNVRRGTELIGGHGSAAPDFNFATLYRLRRWEKGRLENVYSSGKQISAAQTIAAVIPAFA